MERLTEAEILELFRRGIYTADVDNGVIFNRKGKRLKCRANAKGYRIVQFRENGRRKSIMLQRAIWMAATLSPIPEGWEVHHRDGEREHNWFLNLYCLHPLDHDKLHRYGLLAGEEVPF